MSLQAYNSSHVAGSGVALFAPSVQRGVPDEFQVEEHPPGVVIGRILRAAFNQFSRLNNFLSFPPGAAADEVPGTCFGDRCSDEHSQAKQGRGISSIRAICNDYLSSSKKGEGPETEKQLERCVEAVDQYDGALKPSDLNLPETFYAQFLLKKTGLKNQEAALKIARAVKLDIVALKIVAIGLNHPPFSLSDRFTHLFWDRLETYATSLTTNVGMFGPLSLAMYRSLSESNIDLFVRARLLAPQPIPDSLLAVGSTSRQDLSFLTQVKLLKPSSSGDYHEVIPVLYQRLGELHIDPSRIGEAFRTIVNWFKGEVENGATTVLENKNLVRHLDTFINPAFEKRPNINDMALHGFDSSTFLELARMLKRLGLVGQKQSTESGQPKVFNKYAFKSIDALKKALDSKVRKSALYPADMSEFDVFFEVIGFPESYTVLPFFALLYNGFSDPDTIPLLLKLKEVLIETKKIESKVYLDDPSYSKLRSSIISAVDGKILVLSRALGIFYMGERKYSSSVQELSQALKIAKEQADSHKEVIGFHLLLAQTHQAWGNGEDALEHANIALTLTKQHFLNEDLQHEQVHHVLGTLYFTSGDFDQAVTEFMHGLRIHEKVLGEIDSPKSAFFHHYLSRAHKNLGNKDKANRHKERSFEIYSKDTVRKEQQLIQSLSDTPNPYSLYWAFAFYRKTNDRMTSNPIDETDIQSSKMVLNVQKQVLGKEDIDVAMTHILLSKAYTKLNEPEHAMSHKTLAVKMLEKLDPNGEAIQLARSLSV